MASGSKNHIWPAYVDMMTVLLMVYLLLSMIFQMLAALAGPPTTNETTNTVALVDRLTPQRGDFVTSVGRDENFLQPAARASVRDWLSLHAQEIRQHGLQVYSLTVATDAPLGVQLRLQYERSLRVVAIADELAIPRDTIELRNPVPDEGTQDVIVLRLK